MLTTVVEEREESFESGQTQPTSRGSSWILTLLKVAFSVLAIGVVVYTADLSAAWYRIIHQNPWLVGAAAAAMGGQTILGGLRWHVILSRLGASGSVLESLRFFYIAAFFSNWVWSAVAGDVVRVWLASRMHVSMKTAITSVLLDRAAAAAGVAFLVLVTAPVFVEMIGSTALIPAAVAAGSLFGIGVVAQLHRLPLNWQRNGLLQAAESLSTATRMVFLRPRTALAGLGFAVAAQVALSVSAYLLSWSLDIGLTVLDCLVLIQPVVLVTALPISIGGWGVRETAMIGLLAVAGVSPSAALALSVQLGLVSMLIALPGAALWLKLKYRSADQ